MIYASDLTVALWVLLAGNVNHTAGCTNLPLTKSKWRRDTWGKQNSHPGAHYCLLVCIYKKINSSPSSYNRPERVDTGLDLLWWRQRYQCTVRFGYCSAVKYRTLGRRSTVQNCSVNYSTVQYSTILYCTVLYSTVMYCTALHHQSVWRRRLLLATRNWFLNWFLPGVRPQKHPEILD